jgi:hypothetical protein
LEVMWRSGSRRHDWQDGAQIGRLLDTYVRLGLVGPAEWTVEQFGGARRKRSLSLDRLTPHVNTRLASGDGTCSVGGRLPRPWELHLMTSSWNATLSRVEGINMATLRWDSDGEATPEDSSALFETFRSLHGPEDSEFALVHPYAPAHRLAAEVYKPPLVNSHMVAGAYFALYVGPGQIEFFDVDKLSAVRAVRVERDGIRAVWLQGLPILAASGEGEADLALVSLTEEMRAALR